MVLVICLNLLTRNNVTCRIIPQAVSVRYGLSIGAKCAPLVLGMMFILGESARLPLALVLGDWLD